MGVGALLIGVLFKPSVAHARCVVVAEKPTVKRIMGQRAIMAVGARGPDCTEAKAVLRSVEAASALLAGQDLGRGAFHGEEWEAPYPPYLQWRG